MKRKEVLIAVSIAGGLATIGVLAYVLSRKKRQDGMDHTTLEKARKNPQPDQGARAVKPDQRQDAYLREEPKKVIHPPKADEFPLRLGSRGPRVERLQVWLLRNYGHTGKITTVFDEHTEKLLKKHLKTPVLAEGTYYRLKMNEPVYRQSINH